MPLRNMTKKKIRVMDLFWWERMKRIIPGLTANIDYYQENTEELSEVIKQVYSSDGYLAAIKRGVRPVGRIKRLAEFSKEIFLRGE